MTGTLGVTVEVLTELKNTPPVVIFEVGIRTRLSVLDERGISVFEITAGMVGELPPAPPKTVTVAVTVMKSVMVITTSGLPICLLLGGVAVTVIAPKIVSHADALMMVEMQRKKW